METNCIFIKNNANSKEKLWDIQQRTISYSRSPNKMEAILIGYHWKVQSLDRPQKSQVFQRTV